MTKKPPFASDTLKSKCSSRTKLLFQNAFVYMVVDEGISLSKIKITQLASHANRDRKVFYNYYSSVKGIYNEIKNHFLYDLRLQISKDLTNINEKEIINCHFNIMMCIVTHTNIVKLLSKAPYSKDILKGIEKVLNKGMYQILGNKNDNFMIEYHVHGFLGIFMDKLLSKNLNETEIAQMAKDVSKFIL